jgi:proteasome activator subunit 4
MHAHMHTIIILIIQIWQNLLLGKLRMPLDSSFKFSTIFFDSISKVVENKMTGNNGWLPILILERANLQHQKRKVCTTPVFTKTHQTILINVLKLCTSQYSVIRLRAQETIQLALGYFPNAYIVLTPIITEILERDPIVHHSAYKVSICSFKFMSLTKYYILTH